MEHTKYKIHYIDSKDLLILYLPDSLKFYKINHKTKLILDDICLHIDKCIILKKHNIEEDFYEQLLMYLQEKKEYTITPPNTLIKLTLNVSASCNLACKYCYANEGKYKNCEKNMSKETIKRALDTFYGQYDVIQNIMFFGGEPTLNLDVVEYACKYIYEKNMLGQIKFLPNLGMVTNGTNVSKEFINIVNKYNLQLTISLDGPELINDAMRVYKDNSGTHNTIVNNIKLLKKECDQPNTIESTYNKVHVNNDTTVVDVIKYCKDELMIPTIHIAAVSSPKGTSYELKNKQAFIDSIDEVFEYRNNGKDYSYTSFNLVLDGLKNKIVRTHYCEAGISRFSVSVNGDVYPCYIFTDYKDVCLGNIYDENFFEQDNFIRLTTEILKFNKFETEKCGNCFYNTLCRQCIGENYFNGKKLQEVPTHTCDYSKQKAEIIIKNLIK